MSQNLVTLTLADADLAEINAALGTLETKLRGLIDLSPQERQELSKMGPKSEQFVRQTLVLVRENASALPGNFDLAEAENDLKAIDQLRPRLARLRVLVEKMDDTSVALGSDAMGAALVAHGVLKFSGRGQGLDELHGQMSSRFKRGRRQGGNGGGA
jgi:hypothetical protein